MTTASPAGTTIGVLGHTWRASVTPWGDVVPWDGGEPLRWFVAAEDRWHQPQEEANVRQILVEGTPVVETRVRVPGGDVVQRVWCVADHAGLTVVEIQNDSPRAVAVALTRPDLLTTRPPADVPIEGIDLPAGSIVLPVGHRASVRAALAHSGGGPRLLPADLPGHLVVVRGWQAIVERAARIVSPDEAAVAAAVAQRCEVLLCGPPEQADAAGFLLGVHELVRAGERAEPWLPDVVAAGESLLRSARRQPDLAWDVDRALLAAAAVCQSAGEQRAVEDVVAARGRLGERTPAVEAPPAGIRRVAWLEDGLVRPGSAGACSLLPGGIPPHWWGANFEAYHLPAGPGHDVSFAVRWHGARPAVLWEVRGGPGLVLRSGADPSWHSGDARGEALWAPPAGAA